MNEARHIIGTLKNGVVQHFVLTRTGKLSLNGHAKTINSTQIQNLSTCDSAAAFLKARCYWHK